MSPAPDNPKLLRPTSGAEMIILKALFVCQQLQETDHRQGPRRRGRCKAQARSSPRDRKALRQNHQKMIPAKQPNSDVYRHSWKHAP
eukprot:8941069-Pyramimonas_sp.AAC.1